MVCKYCEVFMVDMGIHEVDYHRTLEQPVEVKVWSCPECGRVREESVDGRFKDVQW